MKKKHLYIPLHLNPDNKLTIKRCEVIAGVRLERVSNNKLKKLKDASKRLGTTMPFHPNYGIEIDSKKYQDFVVRNLVDEGHNPEDKLASLPEEFRDTYFVHPHDVVRHVLISLILIQPLQCKIDGIFDFEVRERNSKKKYKVTGYTSGKELVWPSLATLGKARSQVSEIRFSRSLFVETAEKLEKYYRADYWQADRIAVALDSLWSGLASPYLGHAFLSMAVALEALLSTQVHEITHILAERVAIMLAREGQKRYEIYKQVKGLYKLRGKIVHGKSFPKRGTTVTMESLSIDAKRAIVPTSKVAEIINLARDLIRTVLRSPELVLIIQKNESEDTISRKINDFFVKNLFIG